jgi:hypothetical protein
MKHLSEFKILVFILQEKEIQQSDKDEGCQI